MENKKGISLDKSTLKLSSIKKIISGNNTSINVLQGDLALSVSGSELNITDYNVETGILTATGNVEKLEYKKEINGKTLLKKLFK